MCHKIVEISCHESGFVRYYELMNKLQKVRYEETVWTVLEKYEDLLKIASDTGAVRWVPEESARWIVSDPEDDVTVTVGIDPDNLIQKCF